MRLSSFAFTFSLIHSVGLKSSRWEAGLYWDLGGEIHGEVPKPMPDLILHRDTFKYGAVLMETSIEAQG